MSPAELILPSILGLIGLAIILFLLKILVLNLIGDPRRWFEGALLKRKIKLLETVDARFAAKEYLGIPLLLSRAFLLDLPRLDVVLIRFAEDHNSATLARTMNLFDVKQLSPQNLPVVEELLQDRIKLLTSELEIAETLRTLRERRKVLGNKSPSWALDDYAGKLTEIRDKLKTNRRNIIDRLGALFAELTDLDQSDEATYH